MTKDFVSWINTPTPLDGACPLCSNEVENRVFLRVGADAQAVRGPSAVDVARCGRCGSAWFPSMGIEDSYPAVGRPVHWGNLWALIDHYVELAGGLDWKVTFAERLPHSEVGRVLEVGCNTGLLLDYVSRVWGADVVGLEPSAYGQAGAQRFGLAIEPLYMAELIATGVDPFDVVLTTEVIEHVGDPAQFLRELRALVRPGGVVLLTTPNAEGLTANRTPGDLYGMLSVGSHRVIMSARQLTELAHQAGFGSAQVTAEPTTLIAVLSDEPVDLLPMTDPRPRLLGYHDDRLREPEPADQPKRWRLADQIARYALARELAAVDALDGEAQIDERLRTEFDIDVFDLSSLVDRVEHATTLFEFCRIAPLSTPAYLWWRGHRDDISEAVRTEMWEAAVLMIARGISIDPVNLFLLERTLAATLDVLAGRTSQRWSATARAALADAPGLGDHVLPYVDEPFITRLRRSIRSRFPSRSA